MLIGWLVLSACLTTADEYDALLARARDGDGDGFASAEHGGTDCDDSDPLVSPAGVEDCDEVDNDCDGQVDEVGAGAPLWFYDADGDGFGGQDVSERACNAPEGFVGRSDDCDDLRVDVAPGQAELCDGVDNDCDSLVDDDDPDLSLLSALEWYPDADADGYGDSSAEPFLACQDPGGLIQDESDCDDNDRNVNPNATEICQDGVDNDCSGDAPECTLRGEYKLGDAKVSFDGIYSSMDVADTNGDGVSEALLGQTIGDGVVYGFTGVQDGDDLTTGDAAFVIEGEVAGGQFGIVVSAGDLTGSGSDDLYVGAQAASTVTLYETGSGSYSFEPVAEIRGTDSQQRFGQSIRMLSDIGGDPLPSLLVGAQGSRGTQQGALYVWLDAPQSDQLDSDADVEIYDSVFPRFGAADTTSTGDWNGDGVVDLSWGVGVRGQQFVLYGPLSAGIRLESGTADVVINMREPVDSNVSSAAGDLDNDGYVDLLVGESGTGDGVVRLFSGGEGWPSELSYTAAQESIEGDRTVKGVGTVVEVADMDGNGVDDLVFGTPDVGGEAYLFYGPIAGRDVTSQSDATFTGISGDECLTRFILLDINADGASDLVTPCMLSDSSYAILGQGM